MTLGGCPSTLYHLAYLLLLLWNSNQENQRYYPDNTFKQLNNQHESIKKACYSDHWKGSGIPRRFEKKRVNCIIPRWTSDFQGIPMDMIWLL
ncbi:MAG: hypothetical protein ACXAEU_14145 [Candidatus Hodarchaeales archaeon]